MARGDNPETVERVRAICLSIPNTVEKVAHAEPTWRVGGRMFASLSDHHHDDRVGVWLNAPEGAQAMLIDTDPGRFFRPPYVGPSGWVGVWLDVPDVDWEELKMLVDQAAAVTIEQGEAVKLRRRKR